MSLSVTAYYASSPPPTMTDSMVRGVPNSRHVPGSSGPGTPHRTAAPDCIHIYPSNRGVSGNIEKGAPRNTGVPGVGCTLNRGVPAGILQRAGHGGAGASEDASWQGRVGPARGFRARLAEVLGALPVDGASKAVAGAPNADQSEWRVRCSLIMRLAAVVAAHAVLLRVRTGCTVFAVGLVAGIHTVGKQ